MSSGILVRPGVCVYTTLFNIFSIGESAGRSVYLTMLHSNAHFNLNHNPSDEGHGQSWLENGSRGRKPSY